MSLVVAQAGSPWYDTEFFNDNVWPVGRWLNNGVNWMAREWNALFDAIAWPIAQLLDAFNGLLEWLPWPVTVALVVIIGWWVRNWKIGVGSGVGLLAIGFLGADFWALGMQTFAMIITAVVFSVALGLPLGVWSARNNRIDSAVRPVLDAMQTIHPFVYLLPAVFFFGIGTVPGIVVTVIFAMPPMVRLTSLGIRQVPSDVVEAARAFGTKDLQLLREVQLPLAKPTILAGLNQTLMLALSMVVIAALIAAGGIGRAIVRGVGRADIALAGTSGIVVLIIAVILDRISQPGKQAAD
ncbi:MAG: ABC transporter permease [Nitriliruptorales bacterium]